MTLVTVADATVNVREWGSGGDAIVFWHALGPAGSGETINEVAPVLAKHGWRTLAIDGPGFGASPVLPPERYALDELARLALGAADAFAAGRFVFLGHSWGGAVAFAVAAHAPDRVRALVLLDSGHIDYASLPDVDASRSVDEWIADAAARTRHWTSRDAFEAELRADVRRYTPHVLDAFLAGVHAGADGLTGAPPEARGAAMWGLGAPVSDYWPVVAERAIPTLLLLATDPPHVEQNRTHIGRFETAVPHAHVRWVADAGHALLTDVGPPLGDEIAAWLAEHALA